MKKVIYGKTVKIFEYNPLIDNLKLSNTDTVVNKDYGLISNFWIIIILGIFSMVTANKIINNWPKPITDNDKMK